MAIIAVNRDRIVQETNQDESKSICQTIVDIMIVALEALALFSFFVLVPIAGGISSAFVLNDYYRDEGNTYGRAFLNGIIGGAVYYGFNFLNLKFFMIT